MYLKTITLVTLLLGIATASVLVKDDDWIDRLLEKNKDKLEKYVKKDNPIDVQAVILPKPKGFEDPKNWTYDSVLALLKLIKESKTSEPVLKVLRRGIKKSETKFRGESSEEDDDPMETIIRFKDHFQAQLPHSEIRLFGMLDFLSPRDPKYEDSRISSPLPAVGVGIEH